jgi:hypothetical protein
MRPGLESNRMACGGDSSACIFRLQKHIKKEAGAKLTSAPAPPVLVDHHPTAVLSIAAQVQRHLPE